MQGLLSERKKAKQVSNAEAVDRWMGDAVTPDPNDSPPTNAAATNTAVPGYQQADSGTGGSHTNTNTGTNTGTNSGSGTGSGGDSGNDNSNNSGSDSPRGADRTSPNTNGSSDSSNPRRVAEPEEGSNLFVAGLAPTVDDAVLFATYARFGAVISAKVMLRVATGVSRGFGFVLFEKAAQAEAAREATHGTAIKDHGGRLQVSVSKHRGENLAAESRVVYLRNVPTPVFEDAARFEGFLGAFGAKERCVLRAGCTAALTHLIVTFNSVAAARKCVAGSHGKTPFPECAVALMAKMEEPQSLREQRLRGTERNARKAARSRQPRNPRDLVASTEAPFRRNRALKPASAAASSAPSADPPAQTTQHVTNTSLYTPPPMIPGWPPNTNAYGNSGPMGFMPPMPPMPPRNGSPLPPTPPFGMPFPGMWPGFPLPPVPPVPPPMPPSFTPGSTAAGASPNYNPFPGGMAPFQGY